MPEVVGVGAPVNAHFGEADGPEDFLYGFHGAVDLRAFGLVRVRIGFLVIGRENLGNGGDTRVGRRVIGGEDGNGLLLDEGERPVDFTADQRRIDGSIGRAVNVRRTI